MATSALVRRKGFSIVRSSPPGTERAHLDDIMQPLDDRLRAYFRDHDPEGVVSAYLFGSHAEKRAHRESDVDVAVLLDWATFPGDEDRFRVRVRLGSELIRVLHRNEVDVVILNDAPPLLGRRIVNEGRRVYCRSADLDKEFRRDVLIRAADLEPFLERMKRIKLETLRR